MKGATQRRRWRGPSRPPRGAQRAADEGVGRVKAVARDQARGQRREGDETPVVGGDRGERAFGVPLLSFGTDAEERRPAPLSVVQEDVDGLVSVALDQVWGGGLEGDEASVVRDRGNAAVEATVRVGLPDPRRHAPLSVADEDVFGGPFSSPATRFEA